MDNVNVRKEDQILMSLVHYFVTKENYSPIYVHGVKDEIWLEKLDGPYRVIRINNNRIINEEQFRFDQYRINDILRQIKKKTMSLSVNALNINLNSSDDIKNSGIKHIDNIVVHELDDLNNNKNILDIFPNMKDGFIRDTNGLDLIFNVTKDINSKTERDNKKYEKIFSNKRVIATYVIIAICVLMYLITLVMSPEISGHTLRILGANNRDLLRNGEIYRLISYAFLHGSFLHLLCNMYSLYIVGTQIESKFGKLKYVYIYLFSTICGGLLSAAFTNNLSVGASGAIFGLMGSLLYFGYKYRLFLKEAIKNKILPVILLNLFIGFMTPGIDNACHIGGLIAGFLASMVVGINNDDNKDRLNGIILSLIYFIFLLYLVFFR